MKHPPTFLAVLALTVAAASCSSPENTSPIAASVRYKGPPGAWYSGDRIKIEGKLERGGNGDIILKTINADNYYYKEICGNIEFNDWAVSLPVRAYIQVGSSRIVSVTGVAKSNRSRHPTPSRSDNNCEYTLKVDAIDVI